MRRPRADGTCSLDAPSHTPVLLLCLQTGGIFIPTLRMRASFLFTRVVFPVFTSWRHRRETRASPLLLAPVCLVLPPGHTPTYSGVWERGLSSPCPVILFILGVFVHRWEKEMATHSSILAERILWTEELGGLLSVGSHRVGHD